MGTISQYHGSLVAFEGPQDTVSTQLRLLPSSPNILIIPPLRYFLKEENPEAPFDARSRILAVHKACRDRAEMAHAFLRDSTPSNKRLVFMNGGTASAQMECVSDISEYITDGDFTKAERIFIKLVRNGVAGLSKRRKASLNFKPSQIGVTNRQLKGRDGGIANDPVSEAMRAAEALDLQTAFLQTNTEVDLTTGNRPRSSSTPIYRVVDDYQNSTPFYIFGARKWQRRISFDPDLPQTPRRSHTTQDHRKNTRRTLHPVGSRVNELRSQPNSPFQVGEEHPGRLSSHATIDVSSPQSFKFDSTPNTPAICEALVVDVRHSVSAASHKKTKSVDRIYSSAVRNQDILLCSFPQPPRSRPTSTINSPICQGTPATPLPRSPLSPRSPRQKFTTDIPRPTFSTPKRSMVRRNPPSPLKLDKARRPLSYVDVGTSTTSSYVDRGTTTEPEPELTILISPEANMEDSSSIDFSDSFELDPDVPHETVLPMVENLVILFKAEQPDSRLEAMIQAFREGEYPISTSPYEAAVEKNSDQSGNLNPRSIPLVDRRRISYVKHAEVSPACHLDPDEYDPFAYGKYPCSSHGLSPKHDRHAHRPTTPPTPATTPPLATKKPQKCFHDFTTTNCRTAVGMQNSLRSILNIYFPPEDAGYHQFNFPLLPELSSLWKPVFRETDSGTVIHRKRKVDLIVAIGAQQGVDKDFLAAISGSLEKLGTKPNGVTRSGRLDLRFLIASAMQAFTSQPLANQTQDNPFTNPLLLATLIIPHLETYMAAHSATRFLLLEYPPEHLATVLSLQRLVGSDLLRVAGILHSEDIEPKLNSGVKIPTRRNTHLRMNSKSRMSTISTRTGATLHTPIEMKQEAPSFSKANWLLPSSASESEIATLISTIWQILIDISTFYIPDGVAPRASTQIDGELRRGSRRESRGKPLVQTPLINPNQDSAPLSNAAAIMGFQKQVAEASAQYEATPPLPPPKHKHRAVESTRDAPLKSSKGSISETIKSSRTMKSMKSQRNKLRHMLGREADVDNASNRADTTSVYQDYWDEEDDYFAAEERKYMPLYGRQNGPRKGNSRKALKWLGLAT
ncbi:uncharacterized protein F4807DRAFT_54233 [Annulohypoxylon truncatum]|uniref:uncharacterized protein n=1 Tax=Annulohypoxylon truncatum TaxID=327061 RepID=UPI0020077BEE|nr:uncharacterized protein F4807DRAFT_54233 [Annulohypoxylon truncatum]KAI1210638.1 hypothetical protein F4807DRAFT_54233 [Annulohypoxylon truncatum]